jgi:hypothetical protein
MVTMTSGTGVCSITATKAGDTNFFQITSPAKTVDATKAPQAAPHGDGRAVVGANGSTFPVTARGRERRDADVCGDRAVQPSRAPTSR